ncbi:CHAT domain-containing protein [Kitasatospora sp. NPDC097691]|uniref:CHAT domain-containing protein n=1 Tax=Kitasatospora sp. NPDC097691 TaxID=3157231 RepID=UPI003324D4C8
MEENTEPTDAELRGELQELLAQASGAPDDAGTSAVWATAGEWSYRLHLRQGRPEDLRLAAEAMERAFARPGGENHWDAWRVVYGHIRALQYDVAPSPELLSHTYELVDSGLRGLAGDDDAYPEVQALGRQLIARVAKARITDDTPLAERLFLLGDALRRHRDALADTPPDDPEVVEFQAELGHLHYERARLAGSTEDADASAAAYRSALAAAGADDDVPLFRYGLATSLLWAGRSRQNRHELEEARREFREALAAARQRSTEPPWWAPEAETRAIFIRSLLWWQWEDRSHPAAAEAELAPVLARPGAVQTLPPPFLDAFGRLLYDRAAERDDAAGRDRAIALIQEAVRRWQPEQDGPVWGPALLLAMLQHARYRDDQDRRRVPDVVRGATEALAADTTPQIRRTAQLMLGWARHEESGRVLDPQATVDDPVYADAVTAYQELQRDFAEGRAFLNLNDDDFSHLANDLALDRHVTDGFQQLYRLWEGLPPGSAERAVFAARLLGLLPLVDPHNTLVGEAEQAALYQDAAAFEGSDDTKAALRGMLGAVRMRESSATGDAASAEEALAHLDSAAGLLGEQQDGRKLRAGIALARAAASAQLGQLQARGDEMESALEALEQLRNSPEFSPYMRRMLDGQRAGWEAQRAAASGDLAAADRAIAELAAVHRSLDPQDPSRAEVWLQLEHSHNLRDALARRVGARQLGPPAGRPTVAELRRQAARLPRDHQAWVLGDSGIARCLTAGDRGDLRLLAEGLELIEEALGQVDEGSDDWVRYAMALGNGRVGQAAASGGRRGYEAGVAWLERAVARLDGPAHRLWASACLTLGRAYRMRGDVARDDRRRGRHAGLDALRGFAWAALLQSGTEHAATAAARATEAALEAAAWCLEDDVPEQALQALDSCRGLVLHSATVSRSVPERLAAVGRPDLADEWERTGAAEPAPGESAVVRPARTVPSRLRGQVLAVLTGAARADGSAEGLLEPPDPAEIGEALRRLGVDALAYLVPASPDGGGAAVVVTDDGRVRSLPLPRLREDAGPVREYRPDVGAARDLGPATGPGEAPPPLRRQLDRLCSWAWYAAVRPLLTALAPFVGEGRAPRLMLVPMGALGTVPWHAAYEPGSAGRRRYAVEEAEISYAASARLLCDVSRRPHLPYSEAALIVGNPTGDLHYAGEEADALHRSFYPRGGYLGRRSTGAPDGSGTPQEVLEWLRDGRSAGAVLHLACHGTVAAHDRHSSFLSLSGGELAAEVLTETMAADGAARPGLVVLAACRSHVSGRGHNEAYSLATAFLVAGARSVVGSLWTVPDDATSVLMFMTHHFLRRERRTPGQALRSAQLWMLDPGRILPPGMPPALSARALAVEPDDLSTWAGFAHLGR